MDSPAAPEKPITILLLDDEPSVVLALKLLLQVLHFNVRDFSDPERVVAFLQTSEPIDLFLCDLRMPKLNGLQVLAESRRIRPELPFVLMSAHAVQEDIEKAAALGAHSFLSKPFTPQQVQELVASLPN